LLAFLPDEGIDRITKKEKLAKLEPNIITNPDIFKENLDETKIHGYTVSFEERVIGCAYIGAPILDYSGKVTASLDVSRPISRFTLQSVLVFISP